MVQGVEKLSCHMDHGFRLRTVVSHSSSNSVSHGISLGSFDALRLFRTKRGMSELLLPI